MRRSGMLAGAVAIALVLGGCSAGGAPRTPTQPSGSNSPGDWTCSDPLNAPLPTWANAGFTHPNEAEPHFVGIRHDIVAVPFGWPLQSPQHGARQNKILWVAHHGQGPLHIDATDRSTGRTVTKTLINGPGPSLVDVPSAGCWRFQLTWADQRDTVFLRYQGPDASG